MLASDQPPMDAGNQHSSVDVGVGHHNMRMPSETTGVHKPLKTSTVRAFEPKIRLTDRTMSITDTGDQGVGVHDHIVSQGRRRIPGE